MMSYELKGKKALVVGLGRSGIAAARHLVHHGAEVTVNDAKKLSACSPALTELQDTDVKIRCGHHETSLAHDADLIVVSPGVPNDLPLLLEARAKGIPVMSEMELALQEVDRPIIAVTGTNGKTTTVALIKHLLDVGGVRTCVGGNIGTPLTQLLPQVATCDWVVLEVSSFQLEATPSLSPKIAVWLNVTPDHLDRHASFEEYVALKSKLFTALTPSSVGIYNAADEKVATAVMAMKVPLIPFDAWRRLPMGGWYEGGDLWRGLPEKGKQRFHLKEVVLHGGHNRENMLAALIAATYCGIDDDSLQRGLKSFRGLPHRVEFVREVQGVRYYDDSKGTNVGATMRALMTFAEPVVLIAGGLDKGGSYEPLEELVKKGVKRLILIGQAAEKMERALGHTTETLRASSMEEAVEKACCAAVPGDVVLLSPACASFDMFRDYADRGRAFVEAVCGLRSGREKREGKEHAVQ